MLRLFSYLCSICQGKKRKNPEILSYKVQDGIRANVTADLMIVPEEMTIL